GKWHSQRTAGVAIEIGDAGDRRGGVIDKSESSLIAALERDLGIVVVRGGGVKREGPCNLSCYHRARGRAYWSNPTCGYRSSRANGSGVICKTVLRHKLSASKDRNNECSARSGQVQRHRRPGRHRRELEQVRAQCPLHSFEWAGRASPTARIHCHKCVGA